METSPTIGALALALSAAQGEMAAAKKDAENPHFKSRYADLASIWDACRAPLSKHKLAVLQTVAAQGDVVAITTMLAHESGEWVRDVLNLLPRDPSPQSAGSAITYGRRYALAAIVGVAPDDDDGNAASANGNGARQYEGPGQAKQYARPAQGNAPAPAQPGAVSPTPSSPTTSSTRSASTATPASTTDAPPPADDPVKDAAKELVGKLAGFAGKTFATELWESTKDWPKRRDLLAKAAGAAAEIVRVLGKAPGMDLLASIAARKEVVGARVALMVAASLGEPVPASSDIPPF